MTRQVARAAFRAMSTRIEITGVGVSSATVEAAAQRGQRYADAWEQTFSRFRLDSELSSINATPEKTLTVSETFLAVLDLALAGMRTTAGRFDPTMLPALEALGYDQDFSEVRMRTVAPAVVLPPPGAGDLWRMEIDRDARTVRLPHGVKFDLGGIAKGAFVDQLSAELAHWPGGCVDAGGDLSLWGTPPSGQWWVVGIENPARPDTDCLIAEVHRPSFSAATSGTHRRRWRVGSTEAHHLIDPLTRRPLGGAARAATAFADTVTAAEIATKGMIVAAARGEPSAPFGSSVAVVIFDNDIKIIEGVDANVCTFYAVGSARRPT